MKDLKPDFETDALLASVTDLNLILANQKARTLTQEEKVVLDEILEHILEKEEEWARDMEDDEM